jgi:hypothetical protein
MSLITVRSAVRKRHLPDTRCIPIGKIHPNLDLTALGDFKFPVTFAMPHEHWRMQRCEGHVRILVFIPEFAWWREIDKALLTDDHHLLFDVPAEFFDKL